MARTMGGTTTTKFDVQTHPQTIMKLDAITEQINTVVQNINDPILKDIQQLKESQSSMSISLMECEESLKTHMFKQSELEEILIKIFRSKLFRFLNFFGKWVLYTPDDRILINSPENQESINKMRLTAKIVGYSSRKMKGVAIYRANDHYKQLVVKQFIDNHGRTFNEYTYRGAFDPAVKAIRFNKYTISVGDELKQFYDDKVHHFQCTATSPNVKWKEFESVGFPED